VELLAEDELADPDYVETFIATHNYFIDSQSFMSRYVACYTPPTSNVELTDDHRQTDGPILRRR
jgi:hypothetical protein